jgi:hypothetical protein
VTGCGSGSVPEDVALAVTTLVLAGVLLLAVRKRRDGAG